VQRTITLVKISQNNLLHRVICYVLFNNKDFIVSISEVSTHEEETKRLLLNSFQADQQGTFTTMQEFEEVNGPYICMYVPISILATPFF
jgi:hypothetical protein